MTEILSSRFSITMKFCVEIALMMTVAMVILLLMGVLACAVAGEALAKRRIWYKPRRRPVQRYARYLEREAEPIPYWVLTGLYGIAGITFVIVVIAFLLKELI